MAATTLSSIDYNGYRYSVGDVITINSNWYQDMNDTSPSPNDITAYLSQMTFTIQTIYNPEANSSWLNPIQIRVKTTPNASIGGTGMIRLSQIASGGTALFTVGTASVSAYDNRNSSYPSTGGWFESAVIKWSGFAGASGNPIVNYHIYYRECADGGNTPDGNWSGWIGVTGDAGTSGSFTLGSVNQGSSSSSWGNRNAWYQFVVIGIMQDGSNTGWTCTTNWLRKSNAYKQTFSGNGSTSGSTSAIYQFDGYPIVMPTCGFSKTGYTFKGWGTSTTATTTYAANQRVSWSTYAARTWYAIWDANPYTYNIVYKSSSGVKLGTSTVTKDFGTTNSISPKAFTGYNSPAAQSIKWDSTTAKTITFVYTPISYSITYTLNGGTVASANPTYYTIETATFTLNNPTKSGYRFDGWTGSNGTTASKYVSIAKGSTGNKSYTANWTQTIYQMTVYHKKYNASTDEWEHFDTTYDSVNSGSVYTPPYSKTPTGYYNYKRDYNNGWTVTGDSTFNVYYYPNTYTNYIHHVVNGFKNAEGDFGSAKNRYLLLTESFSGVYGTSFVLNESNAVTVPNGCVLNSTYYSYKTATTSSMGTSVVQSAESLSFIYYYNPIDYNITYNLNGGVNSKDNPLTYNVLYGVTLLKPVKIGYAFAGWYIGDTLITGINEGCNATFSSSDDLYTQLASRTTGDITLTAKWRELTADESEVSIYYDGTMEAAFFVESNEEFGIYPGIVYASEFVETDSEWEIDYINKKMRFKSFKEKNLS